jgi:alkylation response protein AidB-like acyl-CoA dehydrogenase
MSSRPDEIRDEVVAWLDENWDLDLTVGEWWQRLADSGWGFPTWPKEWYGRGLDSAALTTASQVFQERGIVGAPGGLGQTMGGPVVTLHGDDDQRARFLGLLASGREGWCQFFSEPGAGSDLAGAQTRAERDGDEWVVTGQKVWTSGARTADRGMLLARVDLDAPKHKGLGYFIIPVDQPGIEVRPLKQMTGAATFNEVFFTEARVAHADLIGRPGDGWAAAVTTLAYERGGRAGTVGIGAGAGAGAAGARNELLARKVADVIAESRRAPRRAASGPTASAVDIRNPGNSGPNSPLTLIKEHGRHDDAVLRDDVTRYYIQTRVNAFNQQRSRAEAAAGKSPGPASSITKLARSIATRMNRDLGPRILGPAGTLSGVDAPHGGAVCQATLQAPSASIAGGTDEIQHNIIGERVLALPKEPEVDRDLPFRELRVGTQR